MARSRMVPEELITFINEEARKDGYQVVDVTARGGETAFYEVALDKEGGISLDECASFNNKIVTWIDKTGLFKGAYIIDVCSPGLDRVLKTDNEFNWAKGKNAAVNLYHPIGEKREINGKIVEVNKDEDIVIETAEGSKVKVDRKNISKAKLAIEL